MTSPEPQPQGDDRPVEMQPPDDAVRTIGSAAPGDGEASMAVQSRDLGAGLPNSAGWPQRLNIVIYAITAVLVVVAAYALIGLVVSQGRIWVDDLRYGRPRTTHLSAMVGHGESRGMPTHITAINLNRRVIIIELPGGDPNVARVIEGPYLIGADQDLTPIELQLEDVDRDGSRDLLVIVRREQIVYLNKDGLFRLPTPAEQAELSREQP